MAKKISLSERRHFEILQQLMRNGAALHTVINRLENPMTGDRAGKDSVEYFQNVLKGLEKRITDLSKSRTK